MVFVSWCVVFSDEGEIQTETRCFWRSRHGLFSDKNVIDNLCEELSGLFAVEMEGAAVAQVAYQERIPWLIVRVISDGADNNAEQTFNEFLIDYQKFSWNLIYALLKRYGDAPWEEKFDFI